MAVLSFLLLLLCPLVWKLGSDRKELDRGEEDRAALGALGGVRMGRMASIGGRAFLRGFSKGRRAGGIRRSIEVPKVVVPGTDRLLLIW